MNVSPTKQSAAAVPEKGAETITSLPDLTTTGAGAPL